MYNNFMDLKIVNKCSELKETIKNDSRVAKLDEIERQMSNSEEVMALAYKKDCANDEYNDALNHFGENNEITNEARKKLYEAKRDLDMHPLVKEYNKAYAEVRLLYKEINDILFDDFKEKC